MRTNRRLAAMAIMLTFSMIVLAQAPKEPAPKGKYTPQEIAQAESKILAANCAVHHTTLPPLTPNGPKQQGPVDYVAFPVDITDDGITKLIPHLQKLPALETLDLGVDAYNFRFAQKFTPKGLKEIAKLSNVKAVRFENSKAITHDGLVELAKMPSLQWLDLSGTTLTDNDLRALANFPSLLTVVLKELPQLTDQGIKHLQQIPRLRTLKVHVLNNPTAMTAEIAKIAKLTDLHIYPITDVETESIAKLTSLQVLDINDPWVSLYGLRTARTNVMPEKGAKPRVKQDRGMNANQLHQITSKGFESILAGCKGLQVLKVAGHPLTFTNSSITKQEFLVELDVSGTDIDDAAVVQLGKMTTLKRLNISATNVTTTGVRELSLLGTLEELTADALPLTEEVIRYISQNRKLKKLSLNNTRVDASDKRSWAAFNRLDELHLMNTNVTDSSIMNLAGIRTLHLVDVRMNCPNVTEDGGNNLRRQLTNAVVWAYGCDTGFWPGGGGDPRRPDLTYRNPNTIIGNTRETSPANMKAPPPTVRTIGNGGLGSKP